MTDEITAARRRREQTTLHTQNSTNDAQGNGSNADSARRANGFGHDSCDTDNPTLEAALGYHRRDWGLAVLEGKKPIADGWQNAQHDETEILRIFAKKNRNIGLRLGFVSGGLADVDLD